MPSMKALCIGGEWCMNVLFVFLHCKVNAPFTKLADKKRRRHSSQLSAERRVVNILFVKAFCV